MRTKEQELGRLLFEAKFNEGAAIRAEKINIAKRLKANDMFVDDIADITGLKIDDILKYCK